MCLCRCLDVITMQIALLKYSQQILNTRTSCACVFAFFAFIQATAFAGVAVAQDFLGPGPILQGYEAPGIKIDDFFINQSASFGVAYDSNILQSATHARSDAIFFVSPFLDVIKTSGRSSQEVNFSATKAEYLSSGTDDYTDIFASARNTYSLTPSSALMAYAAITDGYERRVRKKLRNT